MIKLNRDSKPKILTDNEQYWTSNLLEAIAIHGGYANIPRDLREKLIVNYRHQDIKDTLFESSYEKCAFCETKPSESGYIEIEHYAPKSIYPNLTFKWENFLPVCRKCNGTKSDHDTIEAPIVNPYELNPNDVFHYRDIQITTIENQHREIGTRTIKVCGLNSVRLMKPRADILISLHGFSEALEEAINDYNEADSAQKKIIRKRKIREALEVIERMSKPSEKFSGFCKAYIEESDSFKVARKIIEE